MQLSRNYAQRGTSVIEIQIQDRYSKESVETRPASSQQLSDIDYFREYPHPLWLSSAKRKLRGSAN